MQEQSLKRGLLTAARIFDDVAAGLEPDPLLCVGAAVALAGWFATDGQSSRAIRNIAEEAGDVLEAYSKGQWEERTPSGIMLARRLAADIRLIGEVA